MVIGRSEDRDNPRNPLVLGHHQNVWDPICEPHLGQRPYAPRTEAEHMTAIDQTISAVQTLQGGGRPHMGSGLAAEPVLGPRGRGPGGSAPE
jgi:hypothetical protein